MEVDVHTEDDLVAAPATPLVIAILADVGESHGFTILKRLRELSGGELEWSDGMLYPLLHRLHRLGYVQPEWRTAPGGRRRRYYALTDHGRARLTGQTRHWLRATRALGDGWRHPGGRPIALAGA